eukprot:341092-Pleurochrysis_carterae.AAC.1
MARVSRTAGTMDCSCTTTTSHGPNGCRISSCGHGAYCGASVSFGMAAATVHCSEPLTRGRSTSAQSASQPSALLDGMCMKRVQPPMVSSICCTPWPRLSATS